MFALCQLTEMVRSAGRRHTSDRPAYTREKRTDNKLWFLQNKTPDRPATKPAENTRPGRRPTMVFAKTAAHDQRPNSKLWFLQNKSLGRQR